MVIMFAKLTNFLFSMLGRDIRDVGSIVWLIISFGLAMVGSTLRSGLTISVMMYFSVICLFIFAASVKDN